ncbi:hypothetical protein [Pseudomonas sp. 25 R 14]|nr:hypothetical protein [Pseudomonas sp. 25 R 14]
MSNPRYPEEFKIQAVNQVNRSYSTAIATVSRLVPGITVDVR